MRDHKKTAPDDAFTEQDHREPKDSKVMNSVHEEVTKELGFQTSLFTFFPLPRKNVGKEMTKEVQGRTCMYLGFYGIPYTTIDRRMLEIITTKKVQSKSRVIQFGSVTDTLRESGMGRSGGERGYIKPMKESLLRISGLNIQLTENVKSERFEGITGKNFHIADEFKIFWANGRTDLVVPELLDSLNYMTISEEFASLCDNAAPHIQADYLKIQSALTQDIYPWLCAKLYHLKDKDELIRWSWLYAQFGEGKRMTDNQTKSFRKNFKASGLEIKQDLYQKANYEFTDEGILLKKSPPLIEPDSKKAGFSVFG